MLPNDHTDRVWKTRSFLYYAQGYLNALVLQIDSVRTDDRQLGYRSIDIPLLTELDNQLASLVEKIGTHLVGDRPAPPDGATDSPPAKDTRTEAAIEATMRADGEEEDAIRTTIQHHRYYQPERDAVGSTRNADPYDLVNETPPDPEAERAGLAALDQLATQRPSHARISAAFGLIDDLITWHDQLLTVLTPLATDQDAAFEARDVQAARDDLAAAKPRLADYLIHDHEAGR